MRATRVSAILVAASATLCVGVLFELSNRSGTWPVISGLYLLSLCAAVAAIVAAGVSRPRRRGHALTASLTLPLILTHGMWAFMAVAMTSSWGGFVDCHALGIESPSHVETTMFPTTKWCVSDLTGARASIEPIAEVIVMSVVIALIVAASFALAVHLWRVDARAETAESPA